MGTFHPWVHYHGHISTDLNPLLCMPPQGVPGLHGGGGGGGREARVLDEEEVAAMRERNGIETPGSQKRGPVDSGKGVRIQVRDC